MEIVNTEDMRKMDAEAIHEYGIPGIILMEHAAMAVMDSHGGGGLFTCPYPLQCSL